MRAAIFYGRFFVALLAALLPSGLLAAPGGLAAALQPYVNRHELAGAVTLVASKDKILDLETVGYADIRAKKPMTTDCLFWIASMSKPIAAVALMMLVDDGKVRLNDPVQKYLSRFDPKIMAVTSDEAHVLLEQPHHPITVRNLLSHTAGITFRSSLESPTLDALPLAIRVESYSLEPLMFEPGSDWSYSNAGINTVARIIEVVSGMSYETFLQKRLFDPLHMTNTTFWPTDAQLHRLAKSYKANETRTDLEETPITQLRYPLSDRKDRYALPAGGLFSTAEDLAKFCQMLLSDGVYDGKRYLKPASIREMARNQVAESARKNIADFEPTDGYGLGWFTSASGAFDHRGAYSTGMRIDPRKGLITIWLVQHADFPGDGAKSFDTFEDFATKQFSSVSVAGLSRSP